MMYNRFKRKSNTASETRFIKYQLSAFKKKILYKYYTYGHSEVTTFAKTKKTAKIRINFFKVIATIFKTDVFFFSFHYDFLIQHSRSEFDV